MDDTPEFTMEPVWLVQATYAPDGAETRVPFRAQHLARAARLKAAGVIVEIGAYTDVSASVMLIRAATEAEALEVCREDVYMRNGVWVELRAKPFNRLRLADEGEP